MFCFYVGQLSDFDLNEKGDSIHPDYYISDQPKWQQYVPYSAMEQRDIPSIVDITKHKTRVYLRPQQINRIQKDLEQKEDFPTNFDAKKFLDLGVKPLQRIIDEMKSLTSEVPDESYNPKAAREAGIIKYTDFLHGTVDPERY